MITPSTRWLPPGHTIITCACTSPTIAAWNWRASADGISETTGTAATAHEAQQLAREALRRAAYNARHVCCVGRRGHLYAPGQPPDPDANILTWCRKPFWPGGSGYESRMPFCRRCSRIADSIEDEVDGIHLLVNGRIL